MLEASKMAGQAQKKGGGQGGRRRKRSGAKTSPQSKGRVTPADGSGSLLAGEGHSSL